MINNININSREVAMEAIYKIFVDNSYNNIILKNILKQNGAMCLSDKAFVTEVVNGTLRNIYYIDYVINSFSNTKVEKIKPWLLAILRISIYQILFMDRIPNFAVCDEAVKLTKLKGYKRLSGFVNGVLRNISRNTNNINLPEYRTLEYLNIKYSFPMWLIKMWCCEYDYDFVESLCRTSNMAPDVTIVVNKLKTNVEILKRELEIDNILIENSKNNKNILHIKKTSDITKLSSFKKGYFHIQDESSFIAVEALNPQKGDKILDVCSAPGGKSILCAEFMDNKGLIISRDIYEHKLDLIKESINRLGIEIIKLEKKDALNYYENDFESFDKVIVDVPCSGFGIVRKKPDIKFRRTGNDIDELIKIQRIILENASKYVKKGGTLLYTTCTICKKENIKNVDWFLQNFDFEQCNLSNINDKIYKNFDINYENEKCLTLYPNINNTDGFFISKFIKK